MNSLIIDKLFALIANLPQQQETTFPVNSCLQANGVNDASINDVIDASANDVIDAKYTEIIDFIANNNIKIGKIASVKSLIQVRIDKYAAYNKLYGYFHKKYPKIYQELIPLNTYCSYMPQCVIEIAKNDDVKALQALGNYLDNYLGKFCEKDLQISSKTDYTFKWQNFQNSFMDNSIISARMLELLLNFDSINCIKYIVNVDAKTDKDERRLLHITDLDFHYVLISKFTENHDLATEIFNLLYTNNILSDASIIISCITMRYCEGEFRNSLTKYIAFYIAKLNEMEARLKARNALNAARNIINTASNVNKAMQVIEASNDAVNAANAAANVVEIIADATTAANAAIQAATAATEITVSEEEIDERKHVLVNTLQHYLVYCYKYNNVKAFKLIFQEISKFFDMFTFNDIICDFIIYANEGSKEMVEFLLIDNADLFSCYDYVFCGDSIIALFINIGIDPEQGFAIISKINNEKVLLPSRKSMQATATAANSSAKTANSSATTATTAKSMQATATAISNGINYMEIFQILLSKINKSYCIATREIPHIINLLHYVCSKIDVKTCVNNIMKLLVVNTPYFFVKSIDPVDLVTNNLTTSLLKLFAEILRGNIERNVFLGPKLAHSIYCYFYGKFDNNAKVRNVENMASFNVKGVSYINDLADQYVNDNSDMFYNRDHINYDDDFDWEFSNKSTEFIHDNDNVVYNHYWDALTEIRKFLIDCGEVMQ